MSTSSPPSTGPRDGVYVAVVLVLFLAYVVAWLSILVRTLVSESTPDFSGEVAALAIGLTTIVGAQIAAAFGIEVPKGRAGALNFRRAGVNLRLPTLESLGPAIVFLYFGVALFAGVVWGIKTKATPDLVKTYVGAASGLLLALGPIALSKALREDS